MRQGLRFFIRPGTFINQLQWSSHHWFILLGFLIISAIESHVGRNQFYYDLYTTLVSRRLGITWDQALWLVTALKLGAMLVGSLFIAAAVWVAGNLFGRRTSHRVLFRRLAVVFTVLLAGYTVQQSGLTHPAIPFVTIALYFWGAVFGYFALREQFALSHLEALALGLFALLLLSTTWHYSNHFMRDFAKSQLAYIKAKGR